MSVHSGLIRPCVDKNEHVLSGGSLEARSSTLSGP